MPNQEPVFNHCLEANKLGELWSNGGDDLLKKIMGVDSDSEKPIEALALKMLSQMAKIVALGGVVIKMIRPTTMMMTNVSELFLTVNCSVCARHLIAFLKLIQYQLPIGRMKRLWLTRRMAIQTIRFKGGWLLEWP
ncbi:MAG: hypothetical protein LBM73_01035 [Candidatus Nomurabacteria bacterium]|nr:hypothetical protein [Candidatus Nomurabacteria bacterium]